MSNLQIIIIVALVSMVAMYFAYYGIRSSIRMPEIAGKKKRLPVQNQGLYLLAAIMAATFIVRLVAAASYQGYEVDINCFLAWSDMIFEKGFGNFYTSDAFTDYPPGYMYVLFVVGWIRSLLGIGQYSVLSIVITKLPAILCDMVTGYLVYKIACKKFQEKGAALLAGIFLLTPAILLDSAIWAQVDSVFTMFVVLMCYLFTERKLPQAFFAFAIGILVKPQTLIFGPILLFAVVDYIFLDSFKNDSREVFWKKFFYHLVMGLLAIGLLALLMVPFGFMNAFKQYTETVTSYPYASVNAYNFWTMLGKNWAAQTEKIFGVTIQAWGMMFIVISILFAAYVNFKSKEKESKYYFVAALEIFMIYCMSVRMHERYAYPAIVLLLLAFASRPRKKLYLGYIFLSTICFLNMAHSMFYYDPSNFDSMATVPIWISIGVVAVMIYLVYLAVTHYIRYDSGDMDQIEMREEKEEDMTGKMKSKNRIRKSSVLGKMERNDWIAMAVITVVYAVIAFTNLGNMSAPVTSYSFVEKGEVVLDFGEEVTITRIWDYLGNYNNPQYVVSYSQDPESGYVDAFSEASPWDAGSVFCWNSEETQITGRYVKIHANANVAEDSILELAFEDEDGNLLLPKNWEEYRNLFDEQDFLNKTERFDGAGSWRTGTYFDEIYHARTAYEMVHHLYCYENTHPPLGKIFIALGTLIFGMNPFGWRFMGTLFGVLMLPVLYLFTKKAFSKTWISIATTLLFAFDFMHFVQTRIATIDVFVTFFIILAYYFMYCYTRKSFYDTDLKKTFIPLGLCGIAMGLSWACKWTGIYASVGLAILFFATMWQRFQEYRYAEKNPNRETDGIVHDEIVKTFRPKFFKTIGFCLIFFIAIPVGIYILSYLPFSDGTGHSLIRQVVDNQFSMFSYHSGLEATHPYSSMWYEWPLIKRPIFYYSGDYSETLSEGISSFGNPLVWWVGIPAFFFMLYRAVMREDRKSRFFVIGFLSQYLPWVLIGRVVFIYHFFPSVPFITLMIGYSMMVITEERPKMKKWMFGYVAAAIVLFAMFYPVLTGIAIEPGYVDKYLRWFSGWVLMI